MKPPIFKSIGVVQEVCIVVVWIRVYCEFLVNNEMFKQVPLKWILKKMKEKYPKLLFLEKI